MELAGIRTYRGVEYEMGKPPTRGGSPAHRRPPTMLHRRQRAATSPGTRS